MKEMPTKIPRPASKRDVKFKLGVLRKSRRLMNVSKAASESGVSRNSIYRWHAQYIEHGEKGLEAKKQSKPRHSQRVSETVEPVLALAKNHPNWGCNKIAQELSASGIEVSSPTIQKMLIEHGLATQADRSGALERDWGEGKVAPTAEQYSSMLRHNPCLADRAYYRKVIDVQAVGVGIYPLKGATGKAICNVIVIVDLASLLAKCAVWQCSNDRQGKQILQEQIRNEISAFRDDRKRTLHAVSSNIAFHSPLSMNLLNIKSRKVAGGSGAIRYFFRLLEDSFTPLVHTAPEMLRLDQLEQRLQAWLEEYNTKQRRPGFPTFGLTPKECKSQIKFPSSFCRPFPLNDPSA